MKHSARLAVLVTAIGLAVLGVTGAAAQDAPTAGCRITAVNCTTPVQAQAAISSQDYNPLSDAAMTVSGSTIVVNPNNNLGNGSQDFAFAAIAKVPHPGGGPGAFGFTGFDRHNYGGDTVYQVQFTPRGADSGKCLQATRAKKVVLRDCSSSSRQAWIVTRHVPFLVVPGAPRYVYVLLVSQANTAQRHLCLTGSTSGSGQVTVSRCINLGPGVPTVQQWSGLP